MSEDRIIRRELKLSTSTKQKEERDAILKSRVFPRLIFSVSLGIIYILLLLRIIVMCILYFQSSRECIYVISPKGNDASSPEVVTHTSLPTHTGKVCHIHYGRWSCCGRSCYYFSTEEKTWDESKTSCQNLGSNLTKIEDEEELMLIHSKVKFSAWVGLHAKGGSHLWTWQDGSNLSGNLAIQMTTSSSDALCGRLKRNNIINDVCTKEFYYICEM